MTSQSQEALFMKRNDIIDEIQERYERNAGGILCSKEAGYWSNLNEDENDDLMEYLKDAPSAKEALIRKYPQTIFYNRGVTENQSNCEEFSGSEKQPDGRVQKAVSGYNS